jgi:Ni/Co efflux regulator RcnB
MHPEPIGVSLRVKRSLQLTPKALSQVWLVVMKEREVKRQRQTDRQRDRDRDRERERERQREREGNNFNSARNVKFLNPTATMSSRRRIFGKNISLT